MANEFVHLHLHTQYSFLVGTVKVAELAGRVSELGMNAVAVTDHANMFAAIRQWQSCKAEGVQPIIGCELNIARREGATDIDHLVLLARNDRGYRNLIKLVSASNVESASEASPSVTLDKVAEHTEGLVALTACLNGVVCQSVLENGPDAAEPALGQLKDMFEPGHLYVELQNHGFPEQPIVNEILENAAKSLDLPLVATNDVHFTRADDGEAQLYLECVRLNRQYSDAKETHHGSFEMYLKSPVEMARAFPHHAAALKNTVRVAEMCSELELELGKPMLPHFPIPEGFDIESYFRHVATEGLEQRLSELRALGQNPDEAVYRKRLDHELSVIIGMKYPGYFLIVWDFIREAKARGIPVGPGRGSGAGSLVAYAMGITALDPMPYDLLFERFLNPERVSMPDFDVDFCMSQRDKVIQYVAEKYGASSVGQIATFQNLKARSVIKDVARAMGFPAPDAQRIASLVPDLGQGKTATVEQALEMEPKLKERANSEPQVAELLKQAKKLEGLTRHAGMHAAGVVISEGPLDDHVPVFQGDGALITQYDKDDVESAGLVKFDFLGLKTLTIIDVAERLVNARPDRAGNPLDLSKVPLGDEAAYRLMQSGDTRGVFQLESEGMQKLLRKLKPDCFEDVVAVVALYRPGPLGTGMVDDYVETKHGRKQPRQLHHLVDDVLAPTHGVPVYQEQVMQIAQKLAGYSLGGADLLRRAMGKKKAKEMERQQQVFLDGAEGNGVSREQALAIFKEIEGFASYGFNKSHSAAYALVTYQTAYLKAHYPTEFFAAVLTADKDKTEKVVRGIAEARSWGVSVLPPDINLSGLDFTVVYAHPEGDGPKRGPGKVRDRYGPQIRFGLGAVRGVGEAALESVFEARAAGGDFGDLYDFASRVDAKRLNKGVLEALIQCGAFDAVLAPVGVSRARAFAAVDRALERARSASRDRERGQETLFGMFEAAAAESGNGQSNGAGSSGDEYPMAEEWDRVQLLRRERASLGCYVSGHPMLRYGEKVTRLGATPAAKLPGAEPWSMASVAGMIESYQERIFRSGGGKAAFFEIEDLTGRVKAKLRGDRIDTYQAVLTSGEPALVSGKVSFPHDDSGGDREPTLLVDEVVPLVERVKSSTRSIAIKLEAETTSRRELTELKRVLEGAPGSCPVELTLELPDGARAVMSLGGTRVEPSDQMLSGLERIFGRSVAELR